MAPSSAALRIVRATAVPALVRGAPAARNDLAPLMFESRCQADSRRASARRERTHCCRTRAILSPFENVPASQRNVKRRPVETYADKDRVRLSPLCHHHAFTTPSPRRNSVTNGSSELIEASACRNEQ